MRRVLVLLLVVVLVAGSLFVLNPDLLALFKGRRGGGGAGGWNGPTGDTRTWKVPITVDATFDFGTSLWSTQTYINQPDASAVTQSTIASGQWEGYVYDGHGDVGTAATYAGAAVCQGGTHPRLEAGAAWAPPAPVLCGSPHQFTPAKTAANPIGVLVEYKIVDAKTITALGEVNFGVWTWWAHVDGKCWSPGTQDTPSGDKCYKVIELALFLGWWGPLRSVFWMGAFSTSGHDQDGNGVKDYLYAIYWDRQSPVGYGLSFSADLSGKLKALFSPADAGEVEHWKLTWAGFFVEAAGATGRVQLYQLAFTGDNTEPRAVPTSTSHWDTGCVVKWQVSNELDFYQYRAVIQSAADTREQIFLTRDKQEATFGQLTDPGFYKAFLEVHDEYGFWSVKKEVSC